MNKLKRGDLVRVTMGPDFGHFSHTPFEAIILEEGGRRDSFQVLRTDGGGTLAWVDAGEARFLRHVGEGGIQAQRAADFGSEATEGDPEYFVPAWKSFGERIPGAAMWRLMIDVGFRDPWGPGGEGSHLLIVQDLCLLAMREILNSGDLVAYRDAIRRMAEAYPDGVVLREYGGRAYPAPAPKKV